MKLYLDTSVISSILDKNSKFPKFSLEILNKIKTGIHLGFISDLVINEISKSPVAKRIIFEKQISNNDLKVLKVDKSVLELAEKYIRESLVPTKYKPDAIHIAIATTNSMDALVSWNLKHIVKLKTINGVNTINNLEGYPKIKVVTPEMVIKW